MAWSGGVSSLCFLDVLLQRLFANTMELRKERSANNFGPQWCSVSASIQRAVALQRKPNQTVQRHFGLDSASEAPWHRTHMLFCMSVAMVVQRLHLGTALNLCRMAMMGPEPQKGHPMAKTWHQMAKK